MEWATAVRAGFIRAGYTVAGVRELLGPVAGGALAREQIVPALRLCRGSELGALTRLFWLQVPVAATEVSGAAELVAGELVERSGAELRALVHVEPLEGPALEHLGWVVSDLKARPGTGVLRPDYVVGAGGASASLGKLAVRRPAGAALDLGTGSGVQALYLADRVERLCATDTNPRALALARKTFALSGLPDVETRAGSLFEPVGQRRFDLIVSNPPFVVGPPGGFAYRESGFDGDEMCRRLVRAAPAHLTEGGWCQLLANWLHIDGELWEDRVESWVAGLDCDAWVVQRDVQDPAEYAELWLRDSAELGTPAYRSRYESWLDYFADRKVTGIGFGWISLRRGGTAVAVEELTHAVAEPVGGYVADVLDAIAAADSVDLSAVLLRTAADVLEERTSAPGAEDLRRIVLRQTTGLRRAADVGTVAAALAGVCDGTVALPPLLDAIATLTDDSPDAVRAEARTVLPELIAQGFFTPAPG